MAILTFKEQTEIDAMAKRIAYDYAIAAYSGDDRAEIIASVRYDAIATTMQVLDLRMSFGKDDMLHIGNELYRAGYRRENGKLVLRRNNIEEVI